MKITYYVYDIKYDIDSEDRELVNPKKDLPQRMVISLRTTGSRSEVNLEERLSDAISDLTGFCHNGFKWERIPAVEM